MVRTCTKNKNAHPATPVMTQAAKIKAGIQSTKHHMRKPTKDEHICELQAHLTTLEHPDETATISKEPLVSRAFSHIPHWWLT